MVGFEPTCLSPDKTISSRSRYDHFDTSPYQIVARKYGAEADNAAAAFNEAFIV